MSIFSWLGKGHKFSGFPFVTDMHSHLLPAVDDGAGDVAGSIALIRELERLGYRKLITTPHIYKELYPNTAQTLSAAADVLAKGMEQAGLDIPLRHAAEYFLDDQVDEWLGQRIPLLTIHDNWVLVETSFVQPPLDLNRRLFDLQVAGYRPILAHPERYPYWHVDWDAYHQLRDQGLLFQVNLLSLTGYYGGQVAQAARRLVKEDMVDLVGTDCHHQRHTAALIKESRSIVQCLEPLIRKGRLLNDSL